MPIRASSSPARARACFRPAPASWAGSSTLSSTVRSSSRLKNWKTIPTCRARNLARALSPSLSIRCPATVTEREVGRSSPAMRLSSVDFPLPEGPITAATSPAATSRLMSASAGRAPAWEVLVTSASRITSPPATGTLCCLMGPRWHVRVAARTGAGPRIRGEASPTPDREPSCMGGPGPHAYRGGHGHLRPVSRPASPAVPPRPVVAAGLEPGPVPGRGHPGAALRAAHRGAPVVVVHHPVMGRFPWAPELGEGVAGTAAPPDDRVPRGAGVHPDPAAPAARHGRGADTAAAGHTRPAERNRDRRDGPRAGHLAPARLPPAGRAGPGRGGRHRAQGVAGGSPLHPGVRLRVDASPGDPAPARPVLAAPRAPAALLLFPDGRLPDRLRDRPAGRRALAHRRDRGAGRQGRPGAAGLEPCRGAGTPGGTPGSDPGRRGRRRRRRAAAPGAGLARRHPAAAGLARDAAGHGPRRTPRRGAGATGHRRGPRGGQGRPARASPPGPRPAPGGARGPRSGRGAVRRGGAAAGFGAADRGRPGPAAADDRGGRLLRGLRRPHQHRQARPGEPGGGVRAAGRRPAAHHRQRRRRGRRRPGGRHRPGRPGQPGRVGRRNLRDRQPARRADPAHGGPAMREVAAPGRWIWGLSGLVTMVALPLPGIRLIPSGGQAENAQPQATVTRTVTVTQPVTSLTVQSYGAPVQITAGPVRRVQITETIMYDSQAGNLSAVPHPASASPVSDPPTDRKSTRLNS